jgi:ubiquinone/menaquinone biosynthesis C-methylase UbiE
MPKSKVRTSSQGYDLYAKDYDATFKHLNSFEKGEILPLLGDIENKQIIDLGCGTGRLIDQIKRHLKAENTRFTAVDISEEMLKITKYKFPDVECINADVKSLPFEDESFDIVVAAFLIVHIRDLTKVFNEIYRILKPNGILILTNINQRKAPKLKSTNLKSSSPKFNTKENLIIKSFYHIPAHVIKDLENSLFTIEKEKFIKENGIWINQIIKARKL